ncbi:MAG: hypothetical protein HC888_07515 [Candidatus Competibacteraceae bacterium]|nr:hypothetical protein [Candidatus Competibacteraceae bacterium]
MKRERDVELVITDWGSEIPLANTLPLSECAARVSRFLYVSPDTIRSSQNGKEYFHTARAINVALRNSVSRFLLLAAADELMTENALIVTALVVGRKCSTSN